MEFESYDIGLIRSILDGGPDSYGYALRTGVNSKLLKGISTLAWNYITQYVDTYRQLPGLDVVSHEFNREFNPIGASIEAIVTHLLRRHLYEMQESSMEPILLALQEKNPEKVRDLVDELHMKMKEVSTEKAYQVKSMFEGMEEVVENYEATKRGELGIELPWPTLNKMCMGLLPGTLTYFLASPKTGKTFLAIILARHAWLCGNEVLFVSPEMKRVEIQERFLTIDAGISYRNLVSGELGYFAEDLLNQKIIELKSGNYRGFDILDEVDDMNPKRISAATKDLKPKVVILDSCYDIQMIPGLTRMENMPIFSKWAKEQAKDTMIPHVCMSQLNDERKAALSKQTGWDAHNVVELEQTPDMKADKVLRVIPKMVRRAAHAQDLTLNWDFDRMDYSERAAIIPPRGQSADESNPWSL